VPRPEQDLLSPLFQQTPFRDRDRVFSSKLLIKIVDEENSHSLVGQSGLDLRY
jgi:hypothetical protein